ncbi:MAG: prepilin-type N-terminal cleavage/methylation domain-containing protein [Candidatus Andersenbacteria bacterium]|nr:prepilin-type N-terminal cleavage/methylation domain-containing protein [Candidatus Andersenbacteria bacterium]
MNYQSGFGLAELVIVIGIIGILAGLILASAGQGKKDAVDAAIENSVRQMRWQAEIVFDSQKGSFLNWDQHSLIQSEMGILLEEVDDQYGDSAGAPYVTAVRSGQTNDFCISAPSRARPGSFFCTDARGQLTLTSAHCPEYSEGQSPLRCP